MTDKERAAEIVSLVKAGHKFVPHTLIHMTNQYHKVVFEECDVIYTTLANWFAIAGGRVTSVGYDVLADQHYVVFKVV